MSPSVCGFRSASERIVGAVDGVRQVARKTSSADSAGLMISCSVNAGLLPSAVNRSPHNRVDVVPS